MVRSVLRALLPQEAPSRTPNHITANNDELEAARNAPDAWASAPSSSAYGESATPSKGVRRTTAAASSLPSRLRGLATLAFRTAVARVRPLSPSLLLPKGGRWRGRVMRLLVAVYVLCMLAALPIMLWPHRRSVSRTSNSAHSSSSSSSRSTTKGNNNKASFISYWNAPLRAAEEEAKKNALEEAPKLAKIEAQRLAKEAFRQRKLEERLMNQTLKLERMAAKRRPRRGPGPEVTMTAASSSSTSSSRYGYDSSKKGGGASSKNGAAGASSKGNKGGSSGASSGGMMGANASDALLELLEAQMTPHARCVDGRLASSVLMGSAAADAGKRRRMAKQLAQERAINSGSQRPLLLRFFFSNGFFDHVRLLWYVLLEAELEGAIAILPEAVMQPAPSRKTKDAALLGSLGTVWDLDAYILQLHCFTGVVAVRPMDVGVTMPSGVNPLTNPSAAHIESSGLKKLVGQSRLLLRRTKPVGGAETSMRQLLTNKLENAAAAKPAGAASLLTKLALSTSAAIASLVGGAATAASSVSSEAAVPYDIEVDASGEALTPVRVVETIHQLASASVPGLQFSSSSSSRLLHSGSRVPVRPLLFVSPGELPAMPLVIAAAWANGMAAFSLPMLLQTSAPASRWQQALTASLKPDASGLGASGQERWFHQAVEAAVEVFAERFFGCQGSANFQDVALFRCDGKRPPVGGAKATTTTAAASSARLGSSSLSVPALRRAYHVSLLAAAHPPDGGSGTISEGPSYSINAGAMLRCPAPSISDALLAADGAARGAAATTAVSAGASTTSGKSAASSSSHSSSNGKSKGNKKGKKAKERL